MSKKLKKEGEGLEVDFSELKALLEKLPEMIKQNREEDLDWSLTITRADNGYLLKGKSDNMGAPMTFVIEDDEQDELKSHEELLWEVMEYFSFQGSKHDKERIRVTREK